VTGPVADPDLSEEDRGALRKGIAEFNAGRYFECHDTLEDLWSGIRGPSRDFFQGLIQVAVAFHHLTRGNRVGAGSLLGRALRRLEGYPDRYLGFDLAAHRTELRGWAERVARDTPGPEAPPDALPIWRFDETDGPDSGV
jgi:predicted metal-dependent hydrolase